MSPQAPLDLASLDPAVWHVRSRGDAHGPYTFGQIQRFITDRRIGPSTEVSNDDGAAYQPAAEIPRLTPFFEVIAEPKTSSASNFLVVARSTSGSSIEARTAIARVLNSVGKFAETLPGSYVLRSSLRLAEIRRQLAEVASEDTQFLILEARDGRLGWLGLPQGVDTHIRSVWNAKLDEGAAE